MPDKGTHAAAGKAIIAATILAIDSNFDSVTQATFHYREANVYPYFQSKGLEIAPFLGPLARRYYVAPEAKKAAIRYITGAGHGSYDLFTGDYCEAVFRVGNYHADEVRGKIIHLLACQSARDLGPDFVTSGAVAFFGYGEDFIFLTPLKDLFLECDSEIDRGFADGLTASQVYARVIELYDRHSADLRASGKFREAAILEFNRDNLRCPSSGGTRWGDPEAKLN